MRKLLVLAALAGIFVLPAAASGCPKGATICGTGSAILTDGLIHHRTFSLRQARREDLRYERGWPARVGRCHWRTRWELACHVRLTARIFVQASTAATFVWTDLIAVNQKPLWPILGKWSVESIGLRQIGVIVL